MSRNHGNPHPGHPQISKAHENTDLACAPLHRPNHVVTFLRPKPGQSPTIATFEVPLTFNKFDFRDYLYHLYNVEVTSVRSFINQRMPAQKALAQPGSGQWYRPRAQKLMIVDLVKPFTWPERPAESEMQPWDHKLFKSVEDAHKVDVAKAVAVNSWGPQKMRTDEEEPRERRELRKMAEDLLKGKRRWTPGTQPLGNCVQKAARAAEVGEPIPKVADVVQSQKKRFLADVKEAADADTRPTVGSRLRAALRRQKRP